MNINDIEYTIKKYIVTEIQKHVIQDTVSNHQGATVNRAGTKTSAGGSVAGSASKKLLGEALEAQAASFKKDSKAAKVEKTGKSNTGSGGGNKGGKSVKDEASKNLQKDIKSFLITNLNMKSTVYHIIPTFVIEVAGEGVQSP